MGYRTELGMGEALQRWRRLLRWQRLNPLKRFWGMIERHWFGVLAWAKHGLSNAALEGNNSRPRHQSARPRLPQPRQPYADPLLLMPPVTLDGRSPEGAMGVNLGLLMRKRFGLGTPRGLQGRLAGAIAAFVALVDLIIDLLVQPGGAQLAYQPAGINPIWPSAEMLAP